MSSLYFQGDLNGNMKEEWGNGYYFCMWHQMFSYCIAVSLLVSLLWKRYCKNFETTQKTTTRLKYKCYFQTELGWFSLSQRRLLSGVMLSAEGELWQEEHLPHSGTVQAGAGGRPARWVSSHRQSRGSAGEGKEPGQALLKSGGETECWWIGCFSVGR